MAEKDQTIDALVARARVLTRKLDATVASMEERLTEGGADA